MTDLVPLVRPVEVEYLNRPAFHHTAASRRTVAQYGKQALIDIKW